MSSSKQFIYGLHSVSALLQNQPERILRLCVQKERQDQKVTAILKLANQHRVPIEYVSRVELDKMTHDANHQGVVACSTKIQLQQEADIKQLLAQLTVPPFLLILDGVQDPHNLGACFRSADAAGVHAIIAPKDKAASITPIVSKVACGAAETVPFIQVTNIVRTLEELKEQGIWIYGADGEAEQSLYQSDLRGPIAFVLGAEGSGLRRLTKEHCDMLVKIPMRGSVASLNVSVATAVFLFEAVRQRDK